MSCDDPGTAFPGEPPDRSHRPIPHHDDRSDPAFRTGKDNGLKRFGEHPIVAAGFIYAAVLIIAEARKQDADPPGYRKDTTVGIGKVGGLQGTVALTASGIPIARSCSGGSLTTGSLRRSSPWP
jgi:hypothetical protein